MNYLLLELPIGLDLMEVLWHLLNFALLLIGIRFLLYVPVKKFIAKREKEYSDIEEQNRTLKRQAMEEKKKYEALVIESQSQIVKIAEETSIITRDNSGEILEQARVEAKAIIQNAQNEARLEVNKVMPELQDKSSELAITIAEKILERKINDKDTDKLIDECLTTWSKK